MFGSKFDEIMRVQPSNLNVYDEMAIMQAKVNTTNLELQRLHTHGRRDRLRHNQEERPEK